MQTEIPRTQVNSLTSLVPLVVNGQLQLKLKNVIIFFHIVKHMIMKRYINYIYFKDQTIQDFIKNKYSY